MDDDDDNNANKRMSDNQLEETTGTKIQPPDHDNDSDDVPEIFADSNLDIPANDSVALLTLPVTIQDCNSSMDKVGVISSHDHRHNNNNNNTSTIPEATDNDVQPPQYNAQIDSPDSGAESNNRFLNIGAQPLDPPEHVEEQEQESQQDGNTNHSISDVHVEVLDEEELRQQIWQQVLRERARNLILAIVVPENDGEERRKFTDSPFFYCFLMIVGVLVAVIAVSILWLQGAFDSTKSSMPTLSPTPINDKGGLTPTQAAKLEMLQTLSWQKAYHPMHQSSINHLLNSRLLNGW